MSSKPTVLVLRSSYYQYREYLLRLIAQHADVWLLNDRPPLWEDKYVKGYALVDTLDRDAVVAAANEIDVQFDGVICWDEIRIENAAFLAESLGLPGPSVAGVHNCRDKRLTRLALKRDKVPQPESYLVSTEAEAFQATLKIGYPVVVKPRALAASQGVVLVSSDGDLGRAFRLAQSARENGVEGYDANVLIEEYVKGEEISIDAAWSSGDMLPLFVAHKRTGFPPYFEEVGHWVDGKDPLRQDPRLLNVLLRAHAAVGFHSGITHTEIRLTENGPKVIEINGRLGGDFIPYVGALATGIDPGKVAVEVACGQRPVITEGLPSCAAVRFFYPPYDAVVDDVRIDRELLPTCTEAAATLVEPGTALRLPPADNVSCRFAYVVVKGTSSEYCSRALEDASRALHFSGRPLV